MARTEVVKSQASDWPVSNPWPPLLAGIGLLLLACFLQLVPGQAALVVRIILIVVGLVCGGAAVSLRLHLAGVGSEERARSAGLVAVAALAPLLAYAATAPEWDALRTLLGVMTAVALGGAVLLLLPPAARRVTLSLLVLLHFGGILTAVTSVAPPAGEAPWWVNQVWTRFYRHYLQFMYLNNAYHFYSPEPGPPTLLWFHVEYDDGSARWVRLPEREQSGTRQEYQRRLALTESTNFVGPPIPSELFSDFIIQQRAIAGGLLPSAEPGARPAVPIPFVQNAPKNVQWRRPTPYSRFMTAAYARHIAHTCPSEKNPAAAVTGVKVYRVVHAILLPPQFLDGAKPTAPWTYQPFYQGEFDADGTLKNPLDPFLYWLIPIDWWQREMLPKNFPEDAIIATREDKNRGEMVLIDFTRIHVLRKTVATGGPAIPALPPQPTQPFPNFR
jgi:hypothetical protein